MYVYTVTRCIYTIERETGSERKKREKKNGGSLQSMIVAVTGGEKKRTGKGTPNQLRENHPFDRPFSSLCLPPFNYRSLYFDINVPRGLQISIIRK